MNHSRKRRASRLPRGSPSRGKVMNPDTGIMVRPDGRAYKKYLNGDRSPRRRGGSPGYSPSRRKVMNPDTGIMVRPGGRAYKKYLNGNRSPRGRRRSPGYSPSRGKVMNPDTGIMVRPGGRAYQKYLKRNKSSSPRRQARSPGYSPSKGKVMNPDTGVMVRPDGRAYKKYLRSRQSNSYAPKKKALMGATKPSPTSTHSRQRQRPLAPVEEYQSDFPAGPWTVRKKVPRWYGGDGLQRWTRHPQTGQFLPDRPPRKAGEQGGRVKEIKPSLPPGRKRHPDAPPERLGGSRSVPRRPVGSPPFRRRVSQERYNRILRKQQQRNAAGDKGVQAAREKVKAAEDALTKAKETHNSKMLETAQRAVEEANEAALSAKAEAKHAQFMRNNADRLAQALEAEQARDSPSPAVATSMVGDGQQGRWWEEPPLPWM